MITQIIELLHQHPYYNVGLSIEIAKGKYELPSNFKGIVNKVIRTAKYKK